VAGNSRRRLVPALLLCWLSDLSRLARRIAHHTKLVVYSALAGATTYTEIVRRKADPRDMADIHLHSDYRTVSLY
jgi:hypothetical protein